MAKTTAPATAKNTTTTATAKTSELPAGVTEGSTTTSARAEIRVTVSTNPEERTEYMVVPVGGGDKAQGWNVTPAHDPNGGFVLEEHAETPDAAIAEFSGKFKKDDVTLSGSGDAFVVLHEEKVLAVEATREAAVKASEDLAAQGDGGGLAGVVHPATAAVRDMYKAVGTEGTRIVLNRGGLVSLAR